MIKEVENLIRKSMARDVEIKMLERLEKDIVITYEEVKKILKELTNE